LLESFCVPSSVEFVGESCFRDSKFLSTLTFESHSPRIAELRTVRSPVYKYSGLCRSPGDGSRGFPVESRISLMIFSRPFCSSSR
jgi:hypothetical protein